MEFSTKAVGGTFDSNNSFAAVQELKTCVSKADDKISCNGVRVKWWRVDYCRLLLMYMYISQFDLCKKGSNFSLLFLIEFKLPSYRDKRTRERCMNLCPTFNLSIFLFLLWFFDVYFIFQAILHFTSWNLYPVVLYSNARLSYANALS